MEHGPPTKLNLGSDESVPRSRRMANDSICAEAMAVQSGPQMRRANMATSTSSTVTLRGRSGAEYQFWVYPWGESFKAVGGVYAVLRDDGSTWSVIYIGQTGNLSERFDSHHKADCFDRHRKTHIAARVEESERQRLAIEADLVASYNPPCNG